MSSRGQGLRRMESCRGPDDKFLTDESTLSRPKVKTPGLETQETSMWESYVQCYAICDNGETTTPSETSNATSRECSALCLAVTGDTRQVMFRSRLRRIKSDSDKGPRVGPVSTRDEDEAVKGPSRPEDTTDVVGGLDDETPAIIKSKRETDKGLDESPSPTIDPRGLIGRTSLGPKGQDGTRLRAMAATASLT